MRAISQSVKEKVYLATEQVINKKKDIDLEEIYNVLVCVYGIRFFDIEALDRLARTAAKRMVYVEFEEANQAD